MKTKKNLLRTLLFVSITSIATPVFAKTVKTQKTTEVITTSSTETPVTPPKKRREAQRRSADPANATVWAGAGFLFLGSNFESYNRLPIVSYELGISKSFYNFTPDDFFYLGFIFNYAYSRKDLPSVTTVSYKSAYRLSNEKVFIGYEQSIGVPYIAAFLEAGGLFNQSTFAITSSCCGAQDYAFVSNFGGTFTGGFNFKIVPTNRVSYLFRLAMNVTVNDPSRITLNYNGQTINTSPVTYSPTFSFGVRM